MPGVSIHWQLSLFTFVSSSSIVLRCLSVFRSTFRLWRTRLIRSGQSKGKRWIIKSIRYTIRMTSNVSPRGLKLRDACNRLLPMVSSLPRSLRDTSATLFWKKINNERQFIIDRLYVAYILSQWVNRVGVYWFYSIRILSATDRQGSRWRERVKQQRKWEV